MRPIRVISLARNSQRRTEFLRRNAHVPVDFFDAVDGHALTPAQIEACGAFTPQLQADKTYVGHSYGCALSHIQLWKEAAAATEPLTIAEDDAVLRLDFAVRSAGMLASLPPGWDMVLWGWNFDSVLQVHPMGSVSPVVMLFDQLRLRNALEAFQALQTPVQAFKLEKAFGLPLYTLSPGGAEKLLKLCVPIKPLSVFLPIANKHLVNVGVDVSTNAVYREMQSFACFPPLAGSPNVRGG